MGSSLLLSQARVSTPGWLRRAGVATVVLATLAGLAVVGATGPIADTARTIGQDAEPSVALALRMAATLADMNAAAIADSLADIGAAAGTSRAFRDGAATLSDDLVGAARNVTYGEAEAAPLRALQAALLATVEAVTESRYLGTGDPLITARRVEWASRVNRDRAAPAAKALADANASVLEDHWAAYTRHWLLAAITGIAALALLTALLAAVQVWLLRRTRRILNPPLAAATIVCAAAIVWFASKAVGAHATLRAAKQDDYDSLLVLFEAKAATNALRADMSLWLLDPAIRPETQARIVQAQDDLLGPQGRDPAEAAALRTALRSALESERSGDPARALAQVPKTAGLLGSELGNVTFGMAEREPATDAVLAVQAAGTLIQSIQALAARDRPAAILRWLGEQPGGGTPLFAAIQTALDRTLDVNQDAFDRDIATVLAAAHLIAPVTLAALVAATLLALAGLWLRLREYR